MAPDIVSVPLYADDRPARHSVREISASRHAGFARHDVRAGQGGTERLFRAGSDQTMADVPHHHGQGRRHSESFFFRNVAPDDALQTLHSGGGPCPPQTRRAGGVVRFFETSSQDRAPSDARGTKRGRHGIGTQMRLETDGLTDWHDRGPNLDERPRALAHVFAWAGACAASTPV